MLGMIGIIGLMGCIAASVVVAVAAAASAAASIYSACAQADANEDAREAEHKDEVRQKKLMANQKALAEKKADQLRMTAASGVLLTRIDTRRLQENTKYWTRRANAYNGPSTSPKSFVNRGTYNYGQTAHQ